MVDLDAISKANERSVVHTIEAGGLRRGLQQSSQTGAARLGEMYKKKTSHLRRLGNQACGADGWNMNIE